MRDKVIIVKVWILLTGSLDSGSAPEIHGVYTNVELALPEFKKHCTALYRYEHNHAAISDYFDGEEYYVDNELDYVQLVAKDVTAQVAIGG